MDAVPTIETDEFDIGMLGVVALCRVDVGKQKGRGGAGGTDQSERPEAKAGEK